MLTAIATLGSQTSVSLLKGLKSGLLAIVDVNATVTYADLLAQRRVKTISAEIDLGVCPGSVVDLDRSGQIFAVADLKTK